MCNLLTALETPEERPDLKIKDILSYVTARRTTLLNHALVILKAHALADHPVGDWGPLGSFETWDPIVRGAVWWTTGEDCCTTRKAAATEAPERLNKLALLEAWRALPGGGPAGPGITLEEASKLATPTFNYSTGVTSPEPHPELRQALLRFSPDSTKLPNTQVLSHILRSLKSYKINGLAFAIYGTVQHAVLWHVTDGTPTQPT